MSDPVTADLQDLASADDITTSVEHLIVRFGGGRYALCALDVVEVIRLTHTTRLPGSAGWLAGVVNWRGRVLPVVDLRPVLELPTLPLPSSARIIVMSADDVEVGVLTEAVSGLAPIPELLAALPETMAPGAAGLLRGLSENDNTGIVGVVDTTAVLTLRGRH